MTLGVQTIMPWNYISQCTVSCPSFTSITAHILLDNVRPTPIQDVGIAEVYKFPLASTLAGPISWPWPRWRSCCRYRHASWRPELAAAACRLTATVNGIQVTVNNIQVKLTTSR